MTLSNKTRLILTLVAALAASGFVLWSVWRSPVLARPHVTAVFRGLVVLTFACAGAFTWWRRPTSRFGPLVLVLATTYALAALNAFATPGVYTIGSVALAATVAVFLYVALSFPYGDIAAPSARRAFYVVASVLALLWLLELLLAVDLPRGFPLAYCAHACPHNPFSLSQDQRVAAFLDDVSRAGTVAAAVCVALLMIFESRRRSRAIRRGYYAVFVSLLAVVVALAIDATWQILDRGTPFALEVIAGIAALSAALAIVFGQLRSQVISAWSLRSILRDAGDHSSRPGELERQLRDALGDATLTLSTWDPAENTFPDTQNDAVAAQATSRRVTRRLMFRGRPLGDISYDAHIDDVSDLAQSVATATLLGHSNELLIEQLHETRHAAQTAVREREQLERDLHDGATQRVSSLLLGLTRLRRTLTQSDQLSTDLARLERHALLLREDLRRLSHGIYPAALVERGVLAALSEAMLASSDRITLSGELPRLPGPIEHALYFSTLEAVQNALRHGGAWTRVTVQLAQTDNLIISRVSDNGVGFDPVEQIDDTEHRGLAGMRERVTTVGGTLAVRSEPGAGSSVTVVIPAVTEAA